MYQLMSVSISLILNHFSRGNIFKRQKPKGEKISDKWQLMRMFPSETCKHCHFNAGGSFIRIDKDQHFLSNISEIIFSDVSP